MCVRACGAHRRAPARASVRSARHPVRLLQRKSGWRTMKRPGLDLFLAYLSQFFEIVVVTSQNPAVRRMQRRRASPASASAERRRLRQMIAPMLQRLNQRGNISYFLYRDALRYVNGHHVKDLSVMNRDMSKILVIDIDANGFTLHPDNGVLIKSWKGDPSDRQLLDLLKFLDSISLSAPADVREVLKAYAGRDILQTFMDNQRRIHQEFLRQQQERSKQSKKAPLTKWLSLSSVAPQQQQNQQQESADRLSAVVKQFNEETGDAVSPAPPKAPSASAASTNTPTPAARKTGPRPWSEWFWGTGGAHEARSDHAAAG